MKPESLLCGVVIACGAASLYALFKLIYFAFRRCGVGYEPLGVFCGGLALSLALKCLLSPVIVAVLDAYDQNLWMWGLVTLFFPMIDVVIGGGVFLAAYLCCGAINWRQVRNEAQKCNYRLKGVVLVVLCGACWLLALISKMSLMACNALAKFNSLFCV